MVHRELVALQSQGPRALADLLQQEAAEWRRRLHWDRSEFVRAATRLARRRRLEGWLLLVDGRPVGKALTGAQGGARSIELPYIAPARRGRGHLDHLLAGAAEHLLSDPATRRVEAAFFPFDETEAGASLARRGFRPLRRLYMCREARGGAGAQEPTPPGDGLELARWPAGIAALARIQAAAYQEGPDREASDFYRTVAGCAAYLDALTRGEECGRFAPEISAVVRTGEGEVVAFLLGTLVSATTGHVAQIAVHPAWQGRGLGRALLARYHTGLWAAGRRRSTLLVTTANRRAREWYGRCGYAPSAELATYWWEPPVSPHR